MLLVLNESEPMAAIDCYVALGQLQAEGMLTQWSVYPFLARMRSGLSAEALAAEIEAEAAALSATAVVLTHFHGTGIGPSLVHRLRETCPDASVGFWEGDWYARYRKPFPKSTLQVVRACDFVFVCGEGYVTRLFKQHGCADVRYVPLTGDDRFVPQSPPSSFDFDVVMIGGLARSRLPFKSMPGSIVRRRLVAAFSERFGSRFAVFGPGWTGKCARGPVPYAEQASVYGRAAVVLGCNNLSARYYFSDRLPIGMLSNRPVIHEYVEGYEEVLGVDSGVCWFRSPSEAVAAAARVLEGRGDALVSPGRALSIAQCSLKTYNALDYIIRVLHEPTEGRGTPNCNPWIRRPIL